MPKRYIIIEIRALHLTIACFLVAGIVVALGVTGCGGLERPRPSEAEYAEEYLAYFDATQIEKLDYTYRGSIGGAMTAGRVKFKGPIRLKSELLGAKIKAGTVKEGIHDPAKLKERDRMWIQHQWEAHSGGSIPSWFDFPYDRKLRTLTEESEGGDDPRSHYEKVWYIDDENGVVYIRGNWG
ncbi:MAG: hypothetical protein WCB27_12645 [Thermoguttaceae bacterium]